MANLKCGIVWLASSYLAAFAAGCQPRCSRTVHQVVVPARVALDIWGGPSGDVYVVGQAGLTTHGFNPVPASVSSDLQRVWASGPADVYAIDAEGMIHHSCGECPWRQETDDAQLAVDDLFGVDASHVFAVQPSAILTSSGDGIWTRRPFGFFAPLTSIWASAADDVYAVGQGSVIIHEQGGALRVERQNGAENWNAVWGSSASDVYVGGENNTVGAGAILHSSGDGQWREQSVPGIDSVKTIAGSSASDVWVAGTSPSYNQPCGLAHSTGGDDWRAISIPNCEDGIARAAMIDSSELYLLETNGHVDLLKSGFWLRIEASDRGISYDTEETAPQANDGACDWPRG